MSRRALRPGWSCASSRACTSPGGAGPASSRRSSLPRERRTSSPRPPWEWGRRAPGGREDAGGDHGDFRTDPAQPGGPAGRRHGPGAPRPRRAGRRERCLPQPLRGRQHPRQAAPGVGRPPRRAGGPHPPGAPGRRVHVYLRPPAPLPARPPVGHPGRPVGGRTLLVACIGGGDEMGPAQALEHQSMGVLSRERVARFEEGIVLLRRLLSEEGVTHRGRFYQVEGVTVEPRPVQQPPPLWIANNPTTVTYKVGQPVSAAVVERAFRRVARLADGWMTNKVPPGTFAEQWAAIRRMAAEEGRDPDALGNVLYHNINIQADREAALEESRRFLNAYYTANFSRPFVEAWTAAGPPERCVEELRAYFAAGVQEITLRLASWDQWGQLDRFLREVAPAFRPAGAGR